MHTIFSLTALKEMPTVNDSVTSSLAVKDNKFIMTFDRVCAQNEEDDGLDCRAEWICVADRPFAEMEVLYPCVTNIVYSGRKGVISYLTLEQMIALLKSQHKNLEIRNLYYKKDGCLICAEARLNGLPDIGNMFYIDLPANQIIFSTKN